MATAQAAARVQKAPSSHALTVSERTDSIPSCSQAGASKVRDVSNWTQMVIAKFVGQGSFLLTMYVSLVTKVVPHVWDSHIAFHVHQATIGK